MTSNNDDVFMKSPSTEESTDLEDALVKYVNATMPYEALVFVPQAIYLLGRVMVTASTVVDQSINYPPQGGFKHIENPDSLRRTLLHITRRFYEALSAVHQGMVLIQHDCSKQVKTAAIEAGKAMQDVTPANQLSVIDRILKERLEIIQSASDRCRIQSEKVVQDLKKVEATNDEFLEAVSAHLSHSDCEEASAMLKDTATLIGDLLDKWRQLRVFCQALNHNIELHLIEGTKELMEADRLSLQDGRRNLFFSEDIFEHLKAISQQSYVIGCAGELYVNISDRYIMPVVGVLNVNSSAVDPDEIKRVGEKLMADARKAKRDIVVAIGEAKEVLLAKVKEEIHNIDEILPDVYETAL